MGILCVSLYFHGVDSCLSPCWALLHKDNGHRSQEENDATEERECPAFAYCSNNGIYDSSGTSTDQAPREVEL